MVSFTPTFIYFTEFLKIVNHMPEIRCPKCGITINLKKRKEIDFKLILNALKSRERSFSELLRMTGLPRKTLSLRLTELNKEGVIFKDKLYHLNKQNVIQFESKLPKIRFLENKRTIALLLFLMITLSTTTGFVLAMFSQPSRIEPEPIGYVKTVIKVNNVTDVYGWQVGLRFNASNMKVISISPGSFLTKQGFTYRMDDADPNYIETGTFFAFNLIPPENNILVIGQSLLKEESGVSGSGDLAIVVFAYYEHYEQPQLIFNESPQYTTMLLKKNESEIPLSGNMVTIDYFP